MLEPSSNAAKESRWYVAELVLRITVAGDDRTVVHKDLVLVEARSNQEAYERAIALGHENEISYENPAQQMVQIKFRGLSKLQAVNDRLEHGAELSYEEYVDVSDEKIKEWTPPKELLTVFREIQPSRGPDYSSAEIVSEASGMVQKKDEMLDDG